MSDLSRDQLRVVICFGGLLGLFVQLLAQTFLSVDPGATLTGVFGTLATLPVADSAFEKFSSKRGDPPGPSDPKEETSVTQRRRDERDRIDYMIAAT